MVGILKHLWQHPKALSSFVLSNEVKEGTLLLPKYLYKEKENKTFSQFLESICMYLSQIISYLISKTSRELESKLCAFILVSIVCNSYRFSFTSLFFFVFSLLLPSFLPLSPSSSSFLPLPPLPSQIFLLSSAASSPCVSMTLLSIYLNYITLDKKQVWI